MDLTAPATVGHVQELGEEMNEGFAKVNERFDRLHQDIGHVLDVLINVDKKLETKWENHEVRIQHLEAAMAA
jgi:hypothetical protein